jgi:hypothetical protein
MAGACISAAREFLTLNATLLVGQVDSQVACRRLFLISALSRSTRRVMRQYTKLINAIANP